MTAPHPDLPAEAVSQLGAAVAEPGNRTTTVAAGIPFSAIHWADPGARPLVLIHGVTASARIWWRVGPALATMSRHVIAVDLPGHGRTGHWRGHHRFRDNAADVARADPVAGGYLADDRLPPFEALVGANHILTLHGAPHAPQRTHPVETTMALLRALG